MNRQEQAKNSITLLSQNLRNSVSRNSKENIPLSDDFLPGPNDVICARGKTAFSHPGNQRYRLIIEKNLRKYSTARTKSEKSFIVSSVIESIRDSSSVGFVNFKHGQWCPVEDSVIREKIGQSFRDLLHTKYRSSNKAKKERRRDTIKNNVDRMKASLSANAEHVPFQIKTLIPDPLPFIWSQREILPQLTQGEEKINMNMTPDNTLNFYDMEPIPIYEESNSIGDEDSSSRSILSEVVEWNNALDVFVEMNDSKPVPLSYETISIATESDSSSISELTEWIYSDEELLDTMNSSLF